MADIAALGFEISTAPIDKAAKSMDAMGKSAEGASKATDKMNRGTEAIIRQLESLERAIGANSTATGKLTSEIGKIGSASQKTAVEADKLGSGLQSIVDKSAPVINAQKKMEGQASALSQALANSRIGAEIGAKATENLTEEINQVVPALKDGASATEKLASEAKKASGDIDTMGKSGGQLSSAMTRMAGVITAALSVRQIQQYADTWSDLSSRVRLSIGAQEDTGEVMARLSDIARMTYSSLEATAEGFTRNSMTLRALGKDTQQQLDFTEALNNALVVSGAKGMVFESAQQAIGKAMAEGALRGDELNNILNNGGRIAQLLADDLGVNVTQLRSVASQGKITGDVIYRSLTANMERLREEAASMPATIGDAFTLIRNAVLESVGVFDQAGGFSESFAEQIVAVSDAIRGADIAKYVDSITTAATILAAALASRLGASAYTTAAAFLAAQIQAARYQATLAAMAGVSSTAAARITAVGAAARAASAGMALLGGPAGLVMLAGGALIYLATSASAAEKEAMALDERISKLNGSFKELGEAGKAKAVQDYNDAISGLQKSIEKSERQAVGLNRSLAAMPDSSSAEGWRRKLLEVNAQIESQRGEIVRLTGDLNNLTGAGALAAASVGATSSKVYTDISAKINEQILLHGLNTEAAKLEARINAGLVDGLLAGEAEKLIALQKERDAQVASEEAQKKRVEASKKASEESANAAKAIQQTINGYAQQAATIGMSSRELALYKLQADGATAAQISMAEGLLGEVELREEIAKAVQQQADAMREQRAIQQELDSFRDQKGLSVSSMGMGSAAREQMEAELQVRQEYARRRVELEEAQRVESTRLETGAYNQRLESFKYAESEKIRIMQESNAKRLEAEQNWQLGVQESLQNYVDMTQNYYQMAADATTSILGAATTSIADSLRGILDGTQSLGDAFSNLANSMANAIINALVQMAAQWVVYQALELAGVQAITTAKVVGAQTAATAQVAAIATTQAASSAATAANTATQATAAAATTAAWTPAAIVSSIGSFGSAAAIGLAAVVAALAFTGGFKNGGYTGNGGVSDVAGVVHGREFVFDAASTARIGVGNLENMRRGIPMPGAASGPSMPSGFIGASSSGGSSSGAGVSITIINNADNTRVTREETQDENGQTDIKIQIDSLEQALASRMSSGRGPLHASTRKAFGLESKPEGRG